MKTKNTIIDATSDDIELIKDLLSSHHLPVDDIGDSNIRFYLVKQEDELKACAGVELFDNLGLLRSVAVSESLRGSGIGRELVEFVLKDSKSHGITSLYLLTQTAEHFFGKLGFVKKERDQAPESIKKSSEFTDLCPVSAALMEKIL
ncbi:MAG: arsenic resistance N-acetyltransferase ArsN2 [Balneola sp.]